MALRLKEFKLKKDLGDYNLKKGEILSVENDGYQWFSPLGNGLYGDVLAVVQFAFRHHRDEYFEECKIVF